MKTREKFPATFEITPVSVFAVLSTDLKDASQELIQKSVLVTLRFLVQLHHGDPINVHCKPRRKRTFGPDAFK